MSRFESSAKPPVDPSAPSTAASRAQERPQDKPPLQEFVLQFKAGDTVFTEEDLGATMYIVQSGKVGLFRRSGAEERPVGRLEKGDFFGEMSILEGMPRASTARALEPTELIEINSISFDRMLKGNIEIAIRMLRKLSLRLREVEAKLDEVQFGDSQPASKSTPAPPSRAPDVSGAPAGARLEVPESGIVLPLNGEETTVGRFDPVSQFRPDIDLTDLDLKRTVSRCHARIVRTADGYSIVEEVGAMNGTEIDGVRLEAGHVHPLSDGSRIQIGSVSVVFRC